jgi:hypothetical protein
LLKSDGGDVELLVVGGTCRQPKVIVPAAVRVAIEALGRQAELVAILWHQHGFRLSLSGSATSNEEIRPAEQR